MWIDPNTRGRGNRGFQYFLGRRLKGKRSKETAEDAKDAEVKTYPLRPRRPPASARAFPARFGEARRSASGAKAAVRPALTVRSMRPRLRNRTVRRS